MQELVEFLQEYRVVEGLVGLLASWLFEGWRWFDSLPARSKRKGFIIASLIISLVATVVRASYGDVGSVGDAVGSLILSWLAPLAVGTANHLRYMRPNTVGDNA